MTSEPTHRGTADNRDTDRRRFLRTAGAAAGVAWAAPTVLSATPAAAGLPSPNPCALAVTIDSSTCAPLPGSASFRVDVPDGCPDVPLEIALSPGGGPFQVVLCLVQPFMSIGLLDLNVSVQVRVRWLDACPGGNVIQEVLSPVYGPCGPPPGAPVDGDGAAATVVVTLADGSTQTYTVP